MASTQRGAAVELRGLVKRYGEQTVVKDVSLSIAAGEFVTLLGASGSGKTTTLMMVAGFVEPDGGEIMLDGRPIVRLPPERRNIGIVFQNYALFPHLTVHENIAFPLRMRRMSRPEIDTRVARALDLVDLKGFGDRKIGQLSGGQQQRVALARAIVFEPPLLLMDEPLGALDRKLREQMQIEVKRLQTELGLTVLYVTHDQEEALIISDRIAIMAHGEIQQLGPPAEVYEQPRSAFVADFLGESNLIPVNVMAAEGGMARVTPREAVAPVLHATLRGAVRNGTGRLMIRPESLSILDAGQTADNVIDGTIATIDFLGASVRFSVDTAFGRLLVRVPRGTPSARQQYGRAVQLGCASADMIVFDVT